jgi:signal transduction histidine kinase
MPSFSSPTTAHVAPMVRVAVLAGAAATMATVFFVSRSDILADPWVNAVLRSLSIVCAVGVGAVTLSLRPQSRLGPVLVALGFLYAAASLQASSDPLVYNVGRLVLPVSTLALLYASLAFPTGRLEHPGQRRVMAAVAVVMVTAWTVEALTAPRLPVFSVLSNCDAACPANPFNVVSAGGTTFVTFAAQALSAWAVVVMLIHRMRAATPVQQLTLSGVLCLTALLATAFTAAAVLRTAGADRAVTTVGWVAALWFVAIPLVFLIGQTRGRLFGGAALRRVLALLGPHASATHVERAMAAALGDPSLRVAYPALAGGGFLDEAGRVVAIPDDPAVGVTELRDDGDRVALIVHDPALDDVPGLMDAAGAAALLSMRNAKLSAALRASVRDLRASRARIASAGDEARRRLESDVATGAERQLADVQRELERAARTAATPDIRALLTELASEAEQTLESVHATAQGIYPARLADEGIAKALAAELAGSPAVVIREAAGTARRPQAQEAAVFFSCLEAVQNAIKHAGPGTRTTISLEPAGGGIAFTVSDDGYGFNLERVGSGSGLANIRDRIDAVGGRVRISSAPGRGTTVAGTVT